MIARYKVQYGIYFPSNKQIRRGFNRVDTDGDFCLKIDNEKLHHICHTEDVSLFIRKQ